jgi:hypothetical protein
MDDLLEPPNLNKIASDRPRYSVTSHRRSQESYLSYLDEESDGTDDSYGTEEAGDISSDAGDTGNSTREPNQSNPRRLTRVDISSNLTDLQKILLSGQIYGYSLADAKWGKSSLLTP